MVNQINRKNMLCMVTYKLLMTEFMGLKMQFKFLSIFLKNLLWHHLNRHIYIWIHEKFYDFYFFSYLRNLFLHISLFFSCCTAHLNSQWLIVCTRTLQTQATQKPCKEKGVRHEVLPLMEKQLYLVGQPQSS